MANIIGSNKSWQFPWTLYYNTIIKHFVSMVKEMGFGISCGGVQTQKQLELLQNVGCEQAQGSYYAEPMTAEQFELRYLD